jgi:hypothetical protein
MEREPKLTPKWNALLERFRQSPECADAACGSPRWVFHFLDTMAVCDWSLEGLDIYGLWAALYDGMGWTIDAAPEDPAAVARELHAFLRWAVRSGEVESSREYEVCCTYLASPKAVAEIGSGLMPITICWDERSTDA